MTLELLDAFADYWVPDQIVWNELDLRGTQAGDLSPLHELRSLRRIFLRGSDEREVLRLQHALPDVEIRSHRERPEIWKPDDR